MLIVTTNYDALIDQAFEAHKKSFHVVQWTDNPRFAGSVLWWAPGDEEPKPYPPRSLPLEPGEETIIYKMHGGIVRNLPEWNSFVITEEDYTAFLARMVQQTAIPATFKSHLQSSSFLFLGYGLTDWNLRVLLHNVKRKRSAQKRPAASTDEYVKSWAIQFNPSQLELALWKGRQVNIYNVDINDFVRELRKRME